MPIDSIYDYANRLETLQWAPTKLEPEDSFKETSQRAKTSKRSFPAAASTMTHIPQHKNTPHTTRTKRKRKNYTLTAKDPKQQIWGISGGLLSGGLFSGGLESGGLVSGGLEAPEPPISDVESYTLGV